MLCNRKCSMLEGFPSAVSLYTNSPLDNEQYSRTFFGGLVSTNIPPSTGAAWDENKVDYKIGDVIYISDLKTEFICGENGNIDFPPSSAFWFPRTGNDYRQIDQMPTTKSVSANDVVNVYDVLYANYIVGHFIDGVEKITIETLASDMTTVTGLLDEIQMSEIVEFDCFSCCNPPPEKRRYFSLCLSDKSCSERYIKVTLTRSATSPSIEIGTIAVVRAIEAGKPQLDTTISTDSGIDFQRQKITNDIDAVRLGATIEVTGTAYIEPRHKKILYKKLLSYQGITFTIIDMEELEVLDGVIMGRFSTPSGLKIGLNDNSLYRFKKQGVLA